MKKSSQFSTSSVLLCTQQNFQIQVFYFTMFSTFLARKLFSCDKHFILIQGLALKYANFLSYF